MTPQASASSCCAGESHKQPSEKEKANCAVCFWMAGILPEIAAVVDVRPVDVALVETRQALDQCCRWFIPTDSVPRGPPVMLA